MRVTITHNKPVEEVKTSIDRSFDQVFTSISAGFMEFTDQHRQWQGNTMVFSMTAKMGFIRTPIKGTIDVTAQDVTIDVDLGLLGKLVPEQAVRTGIEGRVKGLLT
jgi:hypothetical protein